MEFYVLKCFLFAILLPTISQCQPEKDFVVFDDSKGPPTTSRTDAPSEQTTTRNENGGRGHCESLAVTQWTMAFHNCFMDRKYKDGGRDLNDIVDRILKHAEDCVEASDQNCLPDRKGFEEVLSKIFHQMKDYSEMYLENITHDRDKVRDLECVEKGLQVDNYVRGCFEKVFSATDNEVESEFKAINSSREVEKSLRCANRKNTGCSIEAKTSTNSMVRHVLWLDNPADEVVEDLQETKEKAKEKEWAWYDYIVQPIISAWNWVTSWFG